MGATLNYFRWYDHVRVTYGVLRAAIYNFRSGTVYSLNSSAAQVTQLIEREVALSQMNIRQRDFVSQLAALDLGKVTYLASPAKDESTPTRQQHPLTFLWLELNGNCNLGCLHCYAESQNPAIFPETTQTTVAGQPMRTAEWCKVLHQAAEAGCRRVQFIGGEVLLHRDLLRLIDEAREAGYTFIEVYTNGTLLTEAKVKALAARDVCLAVSLHGTEAAVHDHITGLPGSFKRTVTGLKWLRQYGIPFRIAGTAMKSNQHNIIHLNEIAADLGADEVSFDVVRDVGSGQNPELMPDDDQVLAQKWLTRPNFVANWADYEHNRRWNPCWAGKLAIASTGEVMPCVMGRSEVVGNVHEEPLARILEKPHLSDLWGLTKDQVDTCRDCEYRYICGDCRPLAISKGDIHGPIPRCTYNPQSGEWRNINGEVNLQIPAPEMDIPLISPATSAHRTDKANLGQTVKGLFYCDPQRETSRQAEPSEETTKHIYQKGRISSNRLFHCDPDR